MKSFIQNQKGSLLPFVLMVSFMMTILILPILQGSILAFKSANNFRGGSIAESAVDNAINYTLKSFLMSTSDFHASKFGGTHTISDADIVPFPVDVTIDVRQPTDASHYEGNAKISATTTFGFYTVTKNLDFDYVDMSNYTAYLAGTRGNLKAGDLIKEHYPGGWRIYIAEDPSRIYENASVFPEFDHDKADAIYAGDQTVSHSWKNGYRVTSGRWIEQMNFNGNNASSSCLLESNSGIDVQLSVNGNAFGNDISIDRYVHEVLVAHLYNQSYKGNNVYYFSGNNAGISMSSPWTINLGYRYRFWQSYRWHRTSLNFATLFGVIISKSPIGFVPVFTMLEGGDWVGNQSGRTRYGEVETGGMWFCFSSDSRTRLLETLRDYTINQGPNLIIKWNN